MDARSTLDAASKLYLSRVEMSGGVDLLVVVDEVHSSTSPFIRAGQVLTLKPEVRVEMPCSYVKARWEVVFHRVITFAVEDEMFSSIFQSGDSVGRRLRTYAASTFRAYMKGELDLHRVIHGTELSHFQLVLENHVVDVLAPADPVVSQVDPYASLMIRT